MGWRYQIPMLREMGLRVIAPDCLGYGKTVGPQSGEKEEKAIAIATNWLKRMPPKIRRNTPTSTAPTISKSSPTMWEPRRSSSVDMTGIATPPTKSIAWILTVKNRGAALAYRVALWHPELVTHVFTVCVPYAAPTKRYLPLEDFVATIAPHFAYQLQFRSGELENVICSEEDIKKFLSALYGGRTEDRQVGFNAGEGVLLDIMAKLRPSKLLSEQVSTILTSIPNNLQGRLLTPSGTRHLRQRILSKWSQWSPYVDNTPNFPSPWTLN